MIHALPWLSALEMVAELPCGEQRGLEGLFTKVLCLEPQSTIYHTKERSLSLEQSSAESLDQYLLGPGMLL